MYISGKMAKKVSYLIQIKTAKKQHISVGK
jgi:hypothetical protein